MLGAKEKSVSQMVVAKELLLEDENAEISLDPKKYKKFSVREIVEEAENILKECKEAEK
ncbi:hypothetical protein Q3F05_11205 [Enterococcus faecium]|nr:hypothetical protein [Enterococcus faecium]